MRYETTKYNGGNKVIGRILATLDNPGSLYADLTGIMLGILIVGFILY